MSRRDLRLVFAAALLLRLAVAAFSRRLIGYSGDSLYDDGIFLQMAESFIGRDPTIFITHPPGLSLFLAPFLAAGGTLGFTLARAAQLLLGAAIAPLTVVLAESLGVVGTGALVAGVLAAASPLLVYFSTRFMSECLFTALVIGFFLFWLEAWREDDLEDAAIAGLFGGAASLTRTVFMPFGAALALAAYLRRRERKRWMTLVLVCGACWAAAIAPWTARNWARYRRFVPISAQGGWNFYEGLVVSEEDAARRPYDMTREAEANHVTDVFEANDYFAAKAKKEIAQDPLGFVWLCLRKALKFWRIVPYYPKGWAGRAMIALFTLVSFGLALVGLRRLPKESGWAFVYAWAIFMTVMHALFASALRYRLPLEPFIFSAAGAAWPWLRSLLSL